MNNGKTAFYRNQILILDENQFTSFVMLIRLKIFGYESTSISKLDYAIELFKKEKFDVLIIDYLTLYKHEKEFIIKLKDLFTNVKKIIISSNNNIKNIKALYEGNIFYFMKANLYSEINEFNRILRLIKEFYTGSINKKYDIQKDFK